MRQIEYVKHGTFQRPRLRGVLLPGGGDWIIQRPDGTMLLDLRGMAKTDDGQLIYLHGRGYFYLPQAAQAKMQAGQTLDWSDQYFRVTLYFETAAGQYAWLNRVLAVGIGEYRNGTVLLTVYEIK